MWHSFFALTLTLATLMIPATTSEAQQQEERLDGRGQGSIVYSRAGGWFVYQGPRGCFALNEYDDGDTLSISASFVTDTATLNLYSERFRSVQVGDDYIIALLFQTPGREPAFWQRTSWEGAGNGRIVAGNLRASDLIRDISAHTNVGLVRDNRVALGLYSLSGSAAAMSALRSCERDVEDRNPTDPFTGDRQ